MLSIMFFIFLSFVGTAAMLFYAMRCQERQCRRLQDDNAELRVLIRALESRLDAPRAPAGAAAPAQEPDPARDPLLHLNFDAPSDSSARPATFREGWNLRDAGDPPPPPAESAPQGDAPRRDAAPDSLPELSLDPGKKA